MLSRWKVAVVTGLFFLGALSFGLGLFPMFAGVFWILWFVGCGACILALVLAVVVPTYRPEADATGGNRPPAGSANGISQP